MIRSMARILMHVLVLLALLWQCSCAQSKTNALWTTVYPDYVAIAIAEAPSEFKELREEKIMHGDDWYWSADGRWLFVKQPIVDRCFGYAGKTLGTPIAMSWDGVIIVAQTLDGSLSKKEGDFANGLAELASIVGLVGGRGH